MGGSAAIQSRPATRDTALFTPEARPATESGAEFIAVAVRGGTRAARPRPNSKASGNTAVQYPAWEPMRTASTEAAAHSRQPATSSGRGPVRCASRPLVPDSSKVTTVTGTSAEPATTGL